LLFRKGTMMKNKKIIWCMILSIVMMGCGVKDEALVLPLKEPEMVVEAATQEEAMQESMICVYVCGAVENPGVVELPEGSRAADALLAVGGLTAEAEEDYVNLAAKVQDGEKLFFPTKAEVELWEEESAMEQKGIVNINTATKEQLMTLSGIGEARAEDILEYRKSQGAFQCIEDLKKVTGIKESLYEKIADKIVVE